MARIVIPLPDADFDTTEVAVPWKLFTRAGHEVVFATEAGAAAACDPLLIRGVLFGQLGAEPEPKRFYEELAQSAAFLKPMTWSALEPAAFDALVLPGGHAPGMRQYLSSEVLQRFVSAFWATQKPVGAICHGVLVLARTKDAATGKSLWEVQVADHKEGYTMTSAPLVLDGLVVVGVAGGETGIRGFLAAFSAADGKRVWQFNTVPGPGEPGHETWAGDSWKTGGASTWSVGAYDPKLDILYWSTGNPWPPFDASSREGDNLYSNSIIALNPKTGKLLWHFQLTPADANDWDATQQIILADITWNGEKVPAALMASRNAFYYALDRRDGRFLYGKPFVKQTWAKGLDTKGRPIHDRSTVPSPQGTLVYPWLHGGTNWWPPTYDPKRKLHYVPTVDAATIYFRLEEKLKPGTMTMRGTTVLATNRPSVMAVKALDPDTGEAKWATRLDEGDFVQFARITGLLSTDGDIVFAGLMDRLSILDADTGAVLWKFRPGALVNAGPATYAIDGVQYFAVIAGNVLFTFSLPPQDIPGAAKAAVKPVAVTAASASAAGR